MVSVGYFATLTGSFGAVKSSGDALEAQRVAEIESNKIKLTDYENLDSKVQQGKWVDAPDNPGWQYFVTLGSEKVIDGDNKQRIAEVKVRRKGDEESRFSTVVPVASSDGGWGNGKDFKVVEIELYKKNKKYIYSIKDISKIIDGPYHHIEVGSKWYNLVDDVVVLKQGGILEVPIWQTGGHTGGHDGGGHEYSCAGRLIVDGKSYSLRGSNGEDSFPPNYFFVNKGSRIQRIPYGNSNYKCYEKGSFYWNQPPLRLYLFK